MTEQEVLQIESAIAEVVGRVRRELEAQIDALRCELAKFERGEPLVEQEWRDFCEGIHAPLRFGVWAPAHSSWRVSGR